MTSLAATERFPQEPRQRGAWLVIGLAILIVPAFFALQAAARAFLIGWVAVLSVGMGAAVLVHINVLTGGRWGKAAGPALAALSATVPVVAIGGIVPLAGQWLIYPWTHGAGLAERGLVGTLYLNPWLFGLRTVVILVGWSMIAGRAAGGRPLTRLTSGACLIFYAFTVNFAAIDWVMSLEPEWTSTSFGALFALTQMALALSVLCIVDAGGPERLTREDIAKFLVAAILAVVYLEFMQYIVQWSGNLPHKVAYFVARSSTFWSAWIVGVILVGALAPFVILSRSALRVESNWVRLAGLLTFLGLLAFLFWQAVPAFHDSWSAVLTVTALIGAFLVFGWLLPVEAARNDAGASEADGEAFR